ncbi:MAG: tyrosine-type recombinase/integrase [Steroidobacteraceae bacterium]
MYQYFGPEGAKKLFLLGSYDPEGVRGLSLPVARDRAAELTALYRTGVLDLHGHFERQRADQERARKSREEAQQRAQEEAQHATLGHLLNTYTTHLKQLGKSSAGDVKSILKKHVFDANSAIIARKAADISVDEFVGLIGAVVDKGKGRTAGKVRSFLRAAYALAIRSKIDPAAPQAMRTFGIVVNPLASTAALSQFNRTRKRHLNALELGAFLKRLDRLSPGPKKDALELCLDLGGQRPTQLLRARETDVDLPGGTITLYDPKGARTQPRVHMLPLTESTFEIVKRRLDAMHLAKDEAKRNREADSLLAAGSMWLFSTDDRTGMREETISELVKNLSEQMVEAGEAREPFQLRDLRRTAETMLAKLGTGPNIRGEVQSHGLGGVQKRHYDQHDYFEEKRAALQSWASHLAALKAGTAVRASAPVENKVTGDRDERSH